jgi:hypothetical protein
MTAGDVAALMDLLSAFAVCVLFALGYIGGRRQ